MSANSRHRLMRFMAYCVDELRSILQIFLLDSKQRIYLERIKQSDQFDRAFYRRQNPQIRPIHLAFPERHYIVYGEPAGLFPNQNFSPAAYMRLNPGLMTGEPALWQYLKADQPSHHRTRDPSPLDEGVQAKVPSISARPPRHPWAVVVHIYYPELWSELEAQINGTGLELDRLITITELGPQAERLAEEIRERYPNDQVWLMPNHGRDIFPWVALINAGALNGYQAVCKLHTKRSPHLREGEGWRRRLLEGLLPGSKTKTMLNAFVDNEVLALLVTREQHLVGPRWWGANQARTVELLARRSIHVEAKSLNFAAGSMYWVKPSVIEAIASLQLAVEDFEPEQGGTDGSTAHAFERMLGYLTNASAHQIGHVECLTAEAATEAQSIRQPVV